MNSELKGLKSGACVRSIEVANAFRDHDIRRTRVYVYWPFAVFYDDLKSRWNITHAPTGYHAKTARSKAVAVDLVQRMLAFDAWDFSDPKGRKCKRVCAAAAKAIPELKSSHVL